MQLPSFHAAGVIGRMTVFPKGCSAYLCPTAVWQQGHQTEAAYSPSPRLSANAVSLNPCQAAATVLTVASPARREGGMGRIREQWGYDIHGGGPLSCLIGITHITSSAICQQGCNAAGVKQSQEANGA